MAAETVAVAAVEVVPSVARAAVAGQCGVGLATGALVVATGRTGEARVVAGLAVIWDAVVTGSAHTGEVALNDCVVLAAQTVRRRWTRAGVAVAVAVLAVLVGRVVVGVSIWARADVVVQGLSTVAAVALVEIGTIALVAVREASNTLTVVRVHVQGVVVALANTIVHRSSRCGTSVAVVSIWAKAGATSWVASHTVAITIHVESTIAAA